MQSSETKDHFSLKAIEPVLKGFNPPHDDFDPDGSWKNSYKIFNLPFMWSYSVAYVGNLTIERSQATGNKISLNINYDKFLRGKFKQQILAKINCSNDPLSTFLDWQFTSKLISPKGATVANTQLSKKGKAPASSGVYASNWALYDAVQRLPRQATKPMEFTLFDHFDQLKVNHTLSFRKAAVVKLGGKDVQLYAYEQLGEGILPIVYWVDEQGRLLFVISGLESYVLTSGDS